MELVELIGWTALGFLPTYVALELGTRKLANRMPKGLFIKTGSKRGGNKEMKINGL